MDATLSEVLGGLVVLAGLGFSLWALIDDAYDLLYVYRYGEVGGPRWIAASGHLLFNLTMTLGWLLFCGVLAVAIYLPSRTDEPAAELAWVVGWLRLGFALCVLGGQIHQRTARFKLRKLPLDAWERMIDNLDAPGRLLLLRRFSSTSEVGRAMGHTVANTVQMPVAVLDEIAEDEAVAPERRQEAALARDALQQMSREVGSLHAQVKALEADP